MMNYGLELEFFVLTAQGLPAPAYKYTANLDGNPVVGELRTDVFPSLIDAYFDLQKKFYIESEALLKKGMAISLTPEIKVTSEFLIGLRKDRDYTSRKENDVLEELSVYDEEVVGKILDRDVFKASLQINLSDNETITQSYRDKDDKYQELKKEVSGVFDFSKIIKKFDKAFEDDIKSTDRVKGVYAIKQGIKGKRIEYRSLPNSIDLLKLLKIK